MSYALKHRTATILAIGALAFIGTSALSSCSLGFTPDKTDSKTSESTADDTPKMTKDDEDADAEDLDDDAPADGTTRADLEGSVDTRLECPGGTAKIGQIGKVVELGSDCAKVTVTGAGTVVLAQNIDRLTVDATAATVFVKQLGSVDATGQGNLVTWESGSPAVSDSGVANTIIPAS